MTLLASLPWVGSPALVPLEMTIDRDHLARMTLDEPELAREVLGLFDVQARACMAELGQAQADAARIVHRLKGAARGVGAFAVAEAADEVEHASDAAARAAAIAALVEAVRLTRQEITEILSLS